MQLAEMRTRRESKRPAKSLQIGKRGAVDSSRRTTIGGKSGAVGPDETCLVLTRLTLEQVDLTKSCMLLSSLLESVNR